MLHTHTHIYNIHTLDRKYPPTLYSHNKCALRSQIIFSIFLNTHTHAHLYHAQYTLFFFFNAYQKKKKRSCIVMFSDSYVHITNNILRDIKDINIYHTVERQINTVRRKWLKNNFFFFIASLTHWDKIYIINTLYT